MDVKYGQLKYSANGEYRIDGDVVFLDFVDDFVLNEIVQFTKYLLDLHHSKRIENFFWVFYRPNGIFCVHTQSPINETRYFAGYMFGTHIEFNEPELVDLIPALLQHGSSVLDDDENEDDESK